MTDTRKSGSIWLALWVVLWATLLCDNAAHAEPVDLALVLAVDASGSVDEDEYALQLGGIARAFRDPDVIEAVGLGPNGRIAVSLMVWAEASIPPVPTDWYVVADQSSAEAFARETEGQPRHVNGGTGIGSGIAHAIRHIEQSGFSASRRVVDVSGDGRETPPRDIVVMIDTARSMALSRGVTVNGLAILSDDPGLRDWYSRHVIAGPDSFVMTANNFEDFAQAMKRKLLREITPDLRLSAAERPLAASNE